MARAIGERLARAVGWVVQHKVAALGISAAAVLAAGGITLWMAIGSGGGPGAVPAVENQTPQEVLAYLASDDFARQPLDVRRDYLRRVKEAGHLRKEHWGADQDGLSDEQRQRLRRNLGAVGKDEMDARIKRYFELLAAERTAHLDAMIDEMQAKIAAHKDKQARRPKPESGSKKEGGKGLTPEHLKGWIEKTDATERAMLMEFKKAFLRRMRERGISEPW